MSEELTSSPSNKKRNKMANDDEDSSKPVSFLASDVS